MKTMFIIIAIMMLFGLTWVFGALTISKAADFFGYLFVITTSFQGFFIFLFLCVMREDVRDMWRNLLCCGKYKPDKRRNTFSSSTAKRRRTSSTYATSYGGSNDTFKMKKTSLAENTGSEFSQAGSTSLTHDNVPSSSYTQADSNIYSSIAETDLATIHEDESELHCNVHAELNSSAILPNTRVPVSEYSLEPLYAVVENTDSSDSNSINMPSFERSESSADVEETPIAEEENLDAILLQETCKELAPHARMRHAMSRSRLQSTQRLSYEIEIQEVAPHITARRPYKITSLETEQPDIVDEEGGLLHHNETVTDEGTVIANESAC